jgi:hypothetical protein
MMMNKIMWVILSIVAVILIGYIIVSFTSKNIETPDYTIIQEVEGVEIRLYPKMIIAKTNLTDNSFDKQGSYGFRTIANYIFGGNAKNQKIAMTAPVVMNIGDSASMYFVMPKGYDKSTLPLPNSGKVEISEESERKLAVIQYDGYSSDHKIDLHAKRLAHILHTHEIQTKGDFLYMGYNAPWDFFNRRNEVAIEVL